MEHLQPPTWSAPLVCLKSACQQAWLHASLPESPFQHQGQCLTRMSPLDSCRQCKASSWLVPAPRKMLEQAAVSRSSTGFEGASEGASKGREERKSLLGLGRAGAGPRPSPRTYPVAHPHFQARVLSHLASASPGCSLGPPMAATPSRPCEGLQLPGHGPSLRGFPLGTESPR